jgi:hypothetical protein
MGRRNDRINDGRNILEPPVTDGIPSGGKHLMHRVVNIGNAPVVLHLTAVANA